jgi:hypothetical protein
LDIKFLKAIKSRNYVFPEFTNQNKVYEKMVLKIISEKCV